MTIQTPPAPGTTDERGRAADVTAYVLVQAEVGRASAVAQQIRTLDGVLRAQEITGPYDVIVTAEASSVKALGELVVARVQQVPGITRTVTCPVVAR